MNTRITAFLGNNLILRINSTSHTHIHKIVILLLLLLL